MTVFNVPCTPGGTARWTQRSALDGVDFLFDFEWRQRDGHWYLTLSDAGGAPIVSGRALTTNGRFLRGVIDTRCPVGELVVVDNTEADDVDPGFADLGSRFLLVYADAAELGR